MDPSPPNCDYETYTINVSSATATAKNDFRVDFQTPLKDIVEFSLIACSIPVPTTPAAEVVYINIPEIQSNFNDYLEPSPNNTGTSSLLRNSIGSVYKTYNGATADTRIIFRNECPIKTRIIHPLERLSSMTIQLFADVAGTVTPVTVPDTVGYYTFQIKCLRKNLCNFNRCN